MRTKKLVPLLTLMILAFGLSAAEPWQIPLKRTAYTRGEQVVFDVPAAAAVSLFQESDRQSVFALGKIDKAQPFAIETEKLAPGNYVLRVEMASGQSAEQPFSVVNNRTPDVYYGLFSVPDSGNINYPGLPYRTDPDRAWRQAADLGFNQGYANVWRESIDSAYKYGFHIILHGNYFLGPYFLAGEKARQEKKNIDVNQVVKEQLVKENRAVILSPSGDPQMYWGKVAPTLSHPQNIKDSCDFLRQNLEQISDLPGLKAVALDDEVGVSGLDFNGGGCGDYSPSSQDFFKKITGLAPAPALHRPVGTVIKDDDPLLLYMEKAIGFSGMDSPIMQAYNLQLAEVVHKARPGLLALQCPGAYRGELDFVHYEVYSYPYGASPIGAAFQADLMLGIAGGKEKKPLIPLIGWFQGLPMPDWTGNYIRLSGLFSLSRSVKGVDLALMSWLGDNSAKFNPDILWGCHHIEPQIRELGVIINKFGPFLRNLTPAKKKTALLYSETTEGFQRILDWEKAKELAKNGGWLETPWEHPQSLDLAYSALSLSGIPVDIVFEDQIKAGRLSDYDHLILVDHQYQRESVVKAIEDFAKNKTVFADKSSAIKPANSVILPWDFSVWTKVINLGLRAQYRTGRRLDIISRRYEGLERESALMVAPELLKKITPAVKLDGPDLVWHLAKAGEGTVLFIFNTNLESPRNGTVELAAPSEYIYNLRTASLQQTASAGNGQRRWDFSVEPGHWQWYLLSPRQISSVKLEAKLADRKVDWQVQVLDRDGNVMPVSLPLEVEILDTRGIKSDYSVCQATLSGKSSGSFTLGINDMQGKWSVNVKDLAAGLSDGAALEYKVQQK